MTRWVEIVAQEIKNIVKESSFDDTYDRKKWRGFVIAAMALNGPISWGRRKKKIKLLNKSKIKLNLRMPLKNFLKFNIER
jgi:hypothetical protein